MKLPHGYVAGTLDSSVQGFLHSLTEPSAGMKYALVTCVDSTPDLRTVVRHSAALQRLAPHGQWLGRAFAIATRRLLATTRGERLFFGFDEVWFFSRRPVVPKPNDVWLTGQETLDETAARKMVAWMERNGCALGIGDGMELLYVARIRGIARHIVDQYTALPG